MSKRFFFLTALILVFVLIGIWAIIKGDLTPPKIIFSKDMGFVGQNQELEFSVEDKKSEIVSVQVSIKQGNNEKKISNLEFSGKGGHKQDIKLLIKPLVLGLKDGRATLIISARDSFLFKNESRVEKKVMVDTLPPQISIRSLSHNINVGGSGSVLYSVSKDALKSGILAGDLFFEGYPVTSDGTYAAYFALPWDASNPIPIMLMAQDSAGNTTKISFPHLILRKEFREVKMDISDSFLNQKMPEFSARYDNLRGSNLDIYLKVNNWLRKECDRRIKAVCSKSHPQRLWDGAFLRTEGSPEAQYADNRTYCYQGREIDKQVHLGVDIAALEQFPVKAANNGIIVFADYLGIYGNTVIIDHGQGIFSLSSHLSSIKVKSGVEVKKGDIIGNTGTTGLAGGDHLHFSMLVHGVFVNPKEWWDPHWIKDNITAKLRPAQSN
ncbi:MAG: M23 family metallopeptidase [Deltaproteobacteria bacterium]|jgi:murein DD-endopeptidase MepM/ murein hydrolase activator NlpD|nr:MAG: M23 family metallopeptidase [Deltaproteobacteria bacterium]